MWSFDNPPVEQIKRKYGFTLTEAWLRKARLSSVRFNDGGSGAFVSDEGLVITNHHVALGQVQKLSTAKNNFVKDGFFARKRTDEIKCPDLEINVLLAYENISPEVDAYLRGVKTAGERKKRLKEILSRLSREAEEKTGYRSDIVSLYNHAEHWIYMYKKYTDVRLVMAPELQAAFFGGDYDNFNYPRFALDYAFFRIYENNKPIESKYYFRWAKEELKEGELVFVSGHPGKTERGKTYSELVYERDQAFPELIQMLKKKLKNYHQYAVQSREKEREVQDKIYRISNGLKAIHGKWKGLLSKSVMQKKEKEDKELKYFLQKHRNYKKELGPFYYRIDKALNEKRKKKKEIFYTSLPESKLVSYAMMFYLYAIETAKPDSIRYPEYRESRLASLKFYLLSQAPIYKDLEIFTFAKSLEESRNQLGRKHEWIRILLGKEKPENLAKRLIESTSFQDSNFRKNLLEGKRESILKSKDPLLLWVRKLEPYKRKFRQWYEFRVSDILEKENLAYGKLKYYKYGKRLYPDANFSLRLSYGTVKGYRDRTGKLPYKTTFYGLVDRALSFEEEPPFQLSPLIKKNLKDLELKTPLNIVSTNDITGGNSGSPVFNKNLEYSALIFDGNAYSHSWDYVFSMKRGRAISVHAKAIIESLEKVYQMDALVNEILMSREK